MKKIIWILFIISILTSCSRIARPPSNPMMDPPKATVTEDDHHSIASNYHDDNSNSDSNADSAQGKKGDPKTNDNDPPNNIQSTENSGKDNKDNRDTKSLKKTESADQNPVKDIRNWRLSGKIGVQTSKSSNSASVMWVQRQNRYTLSLTGALGRNMTLTGRPGSVTLRGSDGKTYHANSPEQILASKWGFHLPVSNMKYWIRGLPVPGMQAKSRYDKSGRLRYLVQQGTRIEYTNYTKRGKYYLPQNLTITSPSIRVKVIVYSWQV